MSMVDLPRLLYIGCPALDNGYGNLPLDANGEYTSFVLRVLRAGTIDRVHFKAGSVTADGDGLRARIETVDSSGYPSGTLVSGSSEVTIPTVTASAWNRSPAGLGAAVAAGDLIAAKLMSPSTGTTFNGNLHPTNGGLSAVFPDISGQNVWGCYEARNIGTPAKFSIRRGLFALEYDDGVTPYHEFLCPNSGGNQYAFGSDSTPDERGFIFIPPARMRVRALWGALDIDGDIDLVLYNAANDVLATVSLDGEQGSSSTSWEGAFGWLTSPVIVEPGQTYRIAIKPTTTGSAVAVYAHDIPTGIGGTRLREMINPLGDATFRSTYRTDAGSWTDVTDEWLNMGLWIDQIDDGAGGAVQYPIGRSIL